MFFTVTIAAGQVEPPIRFSADEVEMMEAA